MASAVTEDEDIKKAIALSLSTDDSASNTVNAGEAAMKASAADTTASKSAGIVGLAGLNRREMEQERLARQAARGLKRERTISPPALRSPRKAPKLEETQFDLPSGARLNFFSTAVKEEQAGRKSTSANDATSHLQRLPNGDKINSLQDEASSHTASTAQGGLLYPKGVVKKTWAFGHQRTGHDVKLEEVLEPTTLRTAVLSAFQWDPDWVLSKLKTPLKGGSTKCVFIIQAKEQSERKRMLDNTDDVRSFLRLCFPPMEGQTFCMHSKLMLLFHPDKVRIAIPSANLLSFDWGETGSMENSVFMIDLPRLESGKAKREDLTFFGEELQYFLERQGVDEKIRDGVLNFDFAATKDMAFVHSVGGTSLRKEAERTGYLGLSRSVRHLGLTTEDAEIDFAASSIGSLNDDQLRSIYSSAKGEDIIARSTAAQAKAKSDFFKKTAKNPAPVNVRDKMRIYFPTYDTVTSSTAGAAGTICLNRKYYENMPFPRSVFRDYISTRQGLLSHNKIMCIRGKRKEGKQVKDVAWAYVGSANMSESAWGKLTHDKKERAWKMNCRNWECGVLLPVPAERLQAVKKVSSVEVKRERSEGDDSETESEDGGEGGDVTGGELVGMDVFDGLVEIPFMHPAPEYGDSEPWYFQEWKG